MGLGDDLERTQMGRRTVGGDIENEPAAGDPGALDASERGDREGLLGLEPDSLNQPVGQGPRGSRVPLSPSGSKAHNQTPLQQPHRLWSETQAPAPLSLQRTHSPSNGRQPRAPSATEPAAVIPVASPLFCRIPSRRACDRKAEPGAFNLLVYAGRSRTGRVRLG